MLNLHTVITGIIENNTFLKTGIHYDVFNLAKLAIFLKPTIELQLEKTISDESIHMQLSRIRRNWLFKEWNCNISLSWVHLQPRLCICIFYKNHLVYQDIKDFTSYVHENNGYFIYTESLDKITIIFEEKFLEVMKNYISWKPLEVFIKISWISSRFEKNHRTESWFLYTLTQQLYFQNISIIEVISSDTEIIFYVLENDAKQAFDAIYDKFSK